MNSDINCVHWNEPDAAKAETLRTAAEKVADEQRDAPAGQWHAGKREQAVNLERALREIDDATLARFCDVLQGN